MQICGTQEDFFWNLVLHATDCILCEHLTGALLHDAPIHTWHTVGFHFYFYDPLHHSRVFHSYSILISQLILV